MAKKSKEDRTGKIKKSKVEKPKISAPKELSESRQSVAKRLKRRGIITSPRGIETEELKRLWDKYKDAPVVVPRYPKKKLTNYETVKNILDNFVQEYKDFFIGWYRDAWRYLPEIEYFYQRIDEEAINEDENFIPQEVHMFFQPPSDWSVDNNAFMEPEDIPDYLIKLYDKYVL